MAHHRSERSHGYDRDIYHGRTGPGGQYPERDYGYDAGNFYPERRPREESYEYGASARYGEPYRYEGPEKRQGTGDLQGLGLRRNVEEPFRRPASERPWSPGRHGERLSSFPASGGTYEEVRSSTWEVPGPYTGRGPKGYRRSDERVFEDVCERLAAHGGLDATEIEVRVDGGEVTLEGMVEDRRTKRLAEDVSETVRGVEDVHNRLRLERHVQAREEGTEPPVETPH